MVWFTYKIQEVFALINVIGLGYIGLPTALILAANGVQVVGTDIDSALVETLAGGQATFEEMGLRELFKKATLNSISFSTTCQVAECYIIAVPTPYQKESKKINASFVFNAVEGVLKVAPLDAIIVIESTISPGTINKEICPLIEASGRKLGFDIHISHAPERIIPGNMIYELENNSRTIGIESPDVGQRLIEIYSTFCKGEIILTDIRTAEMSKVVENTYRDINIAFANELLKICRSDNLDVYEIIRIANKHPRVNILQPGPGVGGHCISVDPWFLVGDYPGLANIILTARKINDAMPEFVIERIATIMKEHSLTDISKVGLYGLTYKEDVDDTRESPTLQLLECLEKHLAKGIKVYDPYINNQIVANQYFDFDAFLNDIDLVVVMVAHSNIKLLQHKLNTKLVLDTRKVIDVGSKIYRL